MNVDSGAADGVNFDNDTNEEDSNSDANQYESASEGTGGEFCDVEVSFLFI
jgi:hypothetical protein